MINLYPHFVADGVYLQTETGELIGRLDEPGEPFETLEEAREKADWLEMVLQFQRSRPGEYFEPVASVPKRPHRSRVSQACN